VNDADAAHDARAGGFVAVHAVGCQRREFQKRRVGVNQRVDALARGEFVAGAVLGEGVRAAARLRPRQRLTILLQKRFKMRLVRAELLVVRVDVALKDGHFKVQVYLTRCPLPVPVRAFQQAVAQRAAVQSRLADACRRRAAERACGVGLGRGL
jgi:hypothetical protein